MYVCMYVCLRLIPRSLRCPHIGSTILRCLSCLLVSGHNNLAPLLSLSQFFNVSSGIRRESEAFFGPTLVDLTDVINKSAMQLNRFLFALNVITMPAVGNRLVFHLHAVEKRKQQVVYERRCLGVPPRCKQTYFLVLEVFTNKRRCACDP